MGSSIETAGRGWRAVQEGQQHGERGKYACGGVQGGEVDRFSVRLLVFGRVKVHMARNVLFFEPEHGDM